MLTAHLITDRDQWNNTVRALPYAHVLQTWEWGEFKRITTGWTPTRYCFTRGDETVAAASILTRRLGPVCVMYVPKGPALKYEDAAVLRSVLDFLEKTARRRLAIWLKIDPDVVAAFGLPPGSDDPDHDQPDTPYLPGQVVLHMLKDRGWRFSDDQVQFRNTITLDLTRTEEDLLAAMSQNTRRKVRTGEKKGVTIRAATLDDLPTLYSLYRTTGQRDDFLTRPAEYYERAWRDFMQAGLAHALIAESDGQALAAVILFHFGRKCWYFYGASSNEQREKMPNHALQWEAMRWAKAQGYTIYDLWGAPDAFVESDPMWGVYEFKRGFRGAVTRYIGAWDYAPYPPMYRAYTRLWPRLLALLRRRSQRKVSE
ncbi:MAG: peptidoglycan bridge formation glycyltransferase FemA/FemB family protein [bacterium]|nr:peptidoglycan bridge formation glycyltransferase FemA/FemB family protein [bacterium]